MVNEISPVVQDYLKSIWSATEWSTQQISTSKLAGRLGVSASTVSEGVRRLTDQGLVEHAPYGLIELTEEGRRLALLMVRRHRLLETYLVERLGYTWDEAHDDAEVLEHAASDRLIDRIDDKLGHPKRDPHGDPIPDRAGNLEAPQAVPLSSLPGGTHGRIARISDADPQILRYFAEVGLHLDTHLQVTERRDFAGVISLQVDGAATPIDVGLIAAEAIWLVTD